ncbi:inactive histone-lysine N-methyltransferase 2E-like isoform X2 [Rhopilema esculentum]|uniref:inactive histone-lysine N-methyltransferase 2E-like isoform X2 n=1 Tax=Rhopilema esculentum TaxID=499914 RepID=UPI0031DE51AB
MPVPKQIKLMMNSLKSAELIRELKAETEKLVETNSMVMRPESDLHDIVNLDGGYNYDSKLNNLSSLRRNVIPYPDHNYGQQPPLTPPEQASPDPNEQTDTGNEDEDEEGVTRCICGFAHDDGYMICCDRCGSWQHIDCMGIKSDSVPETYHCDRCEPRQLDVERARAIQQRKKDTLTDDDGDEDTDTDEESGQTYTAVSNTPTRITLTATPVIKKRGKNRLKSTSSEGNTKQRKRVNRKRQRTSTGQMNETTLQIDSNSLESHSGFENFQEIEENIYDPAIKSLGLENTEETSDHNISKKLFMVADVVENRKGLVAIEAIKVGQIITEYKGKMLPKAMYEESNPFFKRSCPFLLHYNKIDELELVVDARTVGNEARYIRRSCAPNSDVTHVVKDGNLHILVQSKQPLVMGTEITIPFDYPLETYTGYLNCACKEPTCLVLKHNQRYLPQSGRKRSRYSVPDATSSTRNSASENQGETDSDENELDVGRPMSRRKKLSREERKLQAYLKQIEKMEKKEKRVKDPKAPQRPGLIQDQIQTQGSLLTKSLQSFETNSSPNQAISMPRRITACTPGSGKKRININKKRPRISSCSSDPLSPELINCSLTSTTTTPVQEQATHTQILDQNGHIKQKTRKDRVRVLYIPFNFYLVSFCACTRRSISQPKCSSKTAKLIWIPSNGDQPHIFSSEYILSIYSVNFKC